MDSASSLAVQSAIGQLTQMNHLSLSVCEMKVDIAWLINPLMESSLWKLGVTISS